MDFDTKAVHGGQSHDPATGAVMTPIYQTSTYAQRAPGDHQGYEYSRTGNPTRTALERSLASLENGQRALAFSSGLAAIDAVMKLLKPGDEVLSASDLYGGTFRLFTQVFSKYGICFRFFEPDETERIQTFVNEKTKLIWVETPSNPLLKLIDISYCAQVAASNDLLLVVDNTFATPYLQRPLELGADIVMHSATKYLAGHSDLVMGGLVVNDEELAERLHFIQNACGAVPGPMDCFLTLRGIKTLHLRMQRHCENGRAIAEYLRKHDKTERVYWPGFEDHTDHDLARRQMKDFGGMVSFTLKGNSYDEALQVLRGFELFTLAESLGGVESLCGHPASMTHASVPVEKREELGIVQSMIRLSVGIESPTDLITDLSLALQTI